MPISRTGWTLPGDPVQPTDSANKRYVDTKGPLIPGATAMSLAGSTATPQAANGALHHRITTSTSITIAPVSGSVDTQRMLFEIICSAAVTITLDSSYALGGNARTRSIPVRSGACAYVGVLNRAGALQLTYIDDGG